MAAIAIDAEPQFTATAATQKCWGHHCWNNLLLAHWRVPGGAIQALLPRGVSVDTWQGDAWVGLVVFHISGIRPRSFPPLPNLLSFLEVNVRTYVHVDGQQPGVWFFSMDAASTLAVLAARWRWNFNYHRAAIRCQIADGCLVCECTRQWPGKAGVGVRLRARIDRLPGVDAKTSGAGGHLAEAGSLEHFLVERYVYYGVSREGGLNRGRVVHPPYRLHSAEIVELDESLIASAGIEIAGRPDHVCFSPGVRSQVFSPTALAGFEQA